MSRTNESGIHSSRADDRDFSRHAASQRRASAPVPGKLGQLAASANQSDKVQTQIGMAAQINHSAPVQKLADLSQIANGRPSQRQPAAQRVIAVKGGANYTKKEELPEAAQENVTLLAYATSDEKYLVQSASDLSKRAQGEKTPILTPHRHLIGEEHNASKFKQALASWGWGADKMAEGFNTSETVKDKLSDENRSLAGVGVVTNPYYQIKYLENYHASMLGSLAMFLAELKDAKENSEKVSRIAGRVAEDENVESNKSSFAIGENILAKARAGVASIWASHIGKHIPSYQSACTERLKTERGGGGGGPALLHDMATAMKDTWPKLEKNIDYFGKKPYDVFSTWKETSQGLATYGVNAGNFIQKFVEVFASHLLKLTTAESAGLPGGIGANQDTIAEGWQEATKSTSAKPVLQGGSKIREPFMAHNINTKLTKPGLVQIGEEHVTNLDGKITDGKYHKSYDEFVEDTKA